MSELKPGRELDALIAEKVLGHKIAFDANGEPYFEGAALGGMIIGFIPSYSTDIAAAWVIVEKLRLAVWPTGISQWASAARGLWPDDRKRFVCDTAAEAICHCALDAVGVTP